MIISPRTVAQNGGARPGAGRPAGSLSKRTNRAAELFGPHVDDAIETIKEVMKRKHKVLYRKDVDDAGKETLVAEYIPAVKDSDALKAAELICAYGLGKPMQPTEVSGPGGGAQVHEVRVRGFRPGEV